MSEETQVSEKVHHEGDTRQFWASAVFSGLLIGIVMFLTYVPIPAENEGAINMVLGTILGAAALAQPKLFGDKSEQKTQKLEAQLSELRTEYNSLKREHDRLIAMLVERHIVEGNGFKS